MTKEDIIAKICKCLALAESSNPNEAAAALARAQDLMEKYDVTQQDVDLAEVGSETAACHNSKTPPAYIAALIEMINSAFGCQAVLATNWIFSGGWTSAVEFIGFKPRPEVAAYAFDVLRRQLVRGRKEFISGLSKRMKRSTKIKLADNWAEGWVLGAYQKVSDVIISDEDRRRMKDWKNKKYDDLKKCDARPAKKVGQRGKFVKLAGFAEGKNVQIHPAATGNKGPVQIEY